MVTRRFSKISTQSSCKFTELMNLIFWQNFQSTEQHSRIAKIVFEKATKQRKKIILNSPSLFFEINLTENPMDRIECIFFLVL